MARYDRIAPLAPPGRDRAFPGWLVLRDLERDERDADLGRRARLHFLAVQPLRRMLAHGMEQVPADSLERQLEGVREELGQLPARDAERGHLAAFLHRIRQRTPTALVRGSLELGKMAEEAGYRWAAEEFYRTGYELADAGNHTAGKGASLRLLGRLLQAFGNLEEAEDCLTRAAATALELNDGPEWERAVEELASVLVAGGKVERARSTLSSAIEMGSKSGDAAIATAATAALARVELAAGAPDRSVQHAWNALQGTRDVESRARILLDLAASLRRLGLFSAADHAYDLVMASTASPASKSTARAEHALSAAEAGNAAEFDVRGAALAAQLAGDAVTERMRAVAHLRLAQGAALLGRTIQAGEELGEAEILARRKSYPEIDAGLRELLPGIAAARQDGRAALQAPYPVTPSAMARRIGERLRAQQRLSAFSR